MMTCRHVLQLQDAYLDGELSASLNAEVHAHLLQCPACQSEIALARAVGDVIANDRSEPAVEGDFAAKVLEALPRHSAEPTVIELRGTFGQRVWRAFRRGAVPAVAAALFLAILLWPTPPPSGPTLVAGRAVEAVGVDDFVSPTLSAVADAARATESLHQLVEQTADDARRGLSRTLGKKPARPGVPGVSLLDVFLLPFSDVLSPSQPSPEQAAPEVVRF